MLSTIAKDTFIGFEASVKNVGDVCITIGQNNGPLTVILTFDIEAARTAHNQLGRTIHQAVREGGDQNGSSKESPESIFLRTRRALIHLWGHQGETDPESCAECREVLSLLKRFE